MYSRRSRRVGWGGLAGVGSNRDECTQWQDEGASCVAGSGVVLEALLELAKGGTQGAERGPVAVLQDDLAQELEADDQRLGGVFVEAEAAGQARGDGGDVVVVFEKAREYGSAPGSRASSVMR